MSENAPPTAPAAPTGTPPARPAAGPPKWLLAAIVAVALVALFWPRGERISLAPKRQPVDAAGARVELAERFAPVTLLHFWATWCAPCVTEIPALRALAADFAGERRFALVLVAVQDDPRKAADFLGELAATNLYDPTWEVANGWGTSKLPETYLLVNGAVAEKFEGATEWGRADLRARLRTALAAAR